MDGVEDGHLEVNSASILLRMKQAQTCVKKKATESTGAQELMAKCLMSGRIVRLKSYLMVIKIQSLKEKKEMEGAHVISKCE